jgi:uncharacterized coiled-coil protein SlyX
MSDTIAELKAKITELEELVAAMMREREQLYDKIKELLMK